MKLVIALVSTLCLSAALTVAQILLKSASTNINSDESWLDVFVNNPFRIAGALALYCSIFLIYPFVLRLHNFSVIFTTYTCLTIVLVTLASLYFFNERLYWQQMFGIFLIIGGVFFLGFYADKA